MHTGHRKSKKRPVPAKPAAMMSRLTLAIGGRKVEVEAMVPARPTRPHLMLSLFRELANAVVGAAVASVADQGEAISCRASCGACCRQLVPITLPEAHDFEAFLRSLPSPRRRELQARFAAARVRLQESDMLEILLHPERVLEDDKESLALRYFGLGIPCPFLEAESCSIHPRRPIVCREYLVTSDPAHCATPRADTIRMVTLAGKVSSALARVDAGDGEGEPWVPLIVAAEWSRAHPDQGEALPAPDILQKVLANLEKEE
jgi:Fe-S-cluster containining protein